MIYPQIGILKTKKEFGNSKALIMKQSPCEPNSANVNREAKKAFIDKKAVNKRARYHLDEGIDLWEAQRKNRKSLVNQSEINYKGVNENFNELYRNLEQDNMYACKEAGKRDIPQPNFAMRRAYSSEMIPTNNDPKALRNNTNGYMNLDPRMQQHMSRMYIDKNKLNISNTGKEISGDSKGFYQNPTTYYKFINYVHEGKDKKMIEFRYRAPNNNHNELEAAKGLMKLNIDLSNIAMKRFPRGI